MTSPEPGMTSAGLRWQLRIVLFIMGSFSLFLCAGGSGAGIVFGCVTMLFLLMLIMSEYRHPLMLLMTLTTTVLWILSMVGFSIQALHVERRQQNAAAVGIRAGILHGALDQAHIFIRDHEYASNPTSLSLYDPRLKQMGFDQIEVGALDAHSFIIAIGLKMQGLMNPVWFHYVLVDKDGLFSTSCSAPAHTGCVRGHWKLTETFKTRFSEVLKSEHQENQAGKRPTSPSMTGRH